MTSLGFSTQDVSKKAIHMYRGNVTAFIIM
ncbi:hypothetical protein KAOT1_21851 [Kordia algicida OT-1]|uniref:Uncharacterized protein n=1 Tax=Kordia algicida OT-1 TaxID=391587 RepID=A9E0T0_9FLAO|nr:hypothetical protein KAOT1_21851 [Kordia algicida OT-1]